MPRHREILRSGAAGRCLAAARRSGKTALLQTLAVMACRGGARVWYLAPSYAQCRELFLEPVSLALRRLGGLRAINRVDARIELEGGTIWCKSTERPDLLLGRGLDLVLLDEAQSMPESLYDAVLRPMVATTGGRIVVAGTPRGTENLLWRFFDLGQRRVDGWRSWLLTAYEAGTIPRAEVERARVEAERAGPTAAKLWRREWLADWSSFVGQVYPGWDRERMVVDALPFRALADVTSELPLPERVVAGVDWGWTTGHAGVIEVCARHGGRWYVVEEVSAEGRTLPDFWVPQAKRLAARWGVSTFFCDPSQRGTVQMLHRELIGGAVAREAYNAVEDGVLAVAGVMEAGELLVHRSCAQLIRYLPAYVWEQVRSDAGRFRDKPRKVGDNELDALRYAIASAMRRPEQLPF